MELVSIALPVYNAELYIKECLDSVLSQTYDAIEIVIVDDYSTDKSSDIIAQCEDKRIRYYRNQKNEGIVYSLNRAYSLCRGKYIARMDADDICAPNRIERQVNLMKENKEISLISSWFHTFGAADGNIKYATDPEEIKCKLLFSLQLLHPGWMFRRELIDVYGLRYREEYRYAEDWDFLARASRYVKLSNVNEILMHYRVSATQVSTVYADQQNKVANMVAREQLEVLGVSLTDREFAIYRVSLGSRETLLSVTEMEILLSVVQRIIKANAIKDIYNAKVLHHVLAEEMYLLCRYNVAACNKSGILFLKSGYIKYAQLTCLQTTKFLLRCLAACFGNDRSDVEKKCVEQYLVTNQ